MVQALGFMPDADPATPGAFLDCENIVPTSRGFAAAKSLSNSGMPALSDGVRGAAVVTLLSNNRRMFAATPSAIYEAEGTSWVDVSRPGGYTVGGENRFRFAQFGNATIVANQTDKLQVSTAGGFQDIPDAPAARIVETVAGFVLAFATVDPVNGDEPDRWWASGLYDHTAWNPSQATQAANGRLMDSPGEIRAARALGADIVAYKERSMYLGRYVGPPVIWTWQQIPGEIGAISQEAVISIDTAHLFIGHDDFWIFDGSRPQSIGAPVREWFFQNSAPEFRFKTRGYYDRFNGLVYWYFVSKRSTTGVIDDCLVYHVKSNRWGRIRRAITMAVEYVSQGWTFDTVGNKYDTFDDITNITYDSSQWFAAGTTPAVFTPDGRLMLLDGTPGNSSILLNDLGDDSIETTITGVRPRFLITPPTAYLETFYKDHIGGDLQNGPTAELWQGRFDYLWAAKWHRVRVNFVGDVEVTAFIPKLIQDGER